jgi:hypothetical protein
VRVSAEVDAVRSGVRDAGRVSEQHATRAGDPAQLSRQLGRLANRIVIELAIIHLGIPPLCDVDPNGAHQNDLRRATRRAFDVVDEAAKGTGDLGRRTIEADFEVVGAEHEHDDVDRIVAEQAGDEVAASVAAGPRVIIQVRGTPAEPLFDNVIAVSEQQLKPTGPTDIRSQPDILGIVGRIAVGVGIAKTENRPRGRIRDHKRSIGQRPPALGRPASWPWPQCRSVTHFSCSGPGVRVSGQGGCQASEKPWHEGQGGYETTGAGY